MYGGVPSHPPPVEPDPQPDTDPVEAWVLDHLLGLGFSLTECEALIRVRADWHDVARMLSRNCPPVLVLQILL